MNTTKEFLKTLTPVVCLALVLGGCAKTEADKIYDAQACLDKSTSGTALACMDKLEGATSEAAYLIRCSAHFIYQEFTEPARLANVADALKNSSGGASAASALALGLMAFTKPDTSGADTYAAEALDYCTKAKSKGMILLSSMARIATSVVAAGGAAVITSCDTSSPGYNSATCQASVATAICSAPDEVVGNAALTAYQQSCVGGSQSASSMCEQFGAASSGTSDPTTVGEALQDQIKGSGGCP